MIGRFIKYWVANTWLRLLIWLIIGLLIYFFYGAKHSRVQAMVRANPSAKDISIPRFTASSANFTASGAFERIFAAMASHAVSRSFAATT